MTLWFVFALMTAAAIFAVLWPLGRGPRTTPSGSDVVVYRDQLQEIDRDRAAGLIGEVEAEAARVEVSRRLLAADARRTCRGAVAIGWRRRGAALAALILLPSAPSAFISCSARPICPGNPRVRASTRRKVVSRLPSWLARSRRISSAIRTTVAAGRWWRRSICGSGVLMTPSRHVAKRSRSTANSAERQSGLGEALVGVANGVVTAEAKAAFERATAQDPQSVTGRFFLGLAAEQDGKRDEAASIWRKMLADAPADVPWGDYVRSALARVGGPPVVAGPGPTEEQAAAASDMSSAQRMDMIRGMVDRLATKLHSDGSDVEGWLRLVRAYMVLGDRDKAKDAASDAKRALANDPDKLKRVDEFVKGLGLEG